MLFKIKVTRHFYFALSLNTGLFNEYKVYLLHVADGNCVRVIRK